MLPSLVHDTPAVLFSLVAGIFTSVSYLPLFFRYIQSSFSVFNGQHDRHDETQHQSTHRYKSHWISSQHEQITSGEYYNNSALRLPGPHFFVSLIMYFYILHHHKCIFTVNRSHSATCTRHNSNAMNPNTCRWSSKNQVLSLKTENQKTQHTKKNMPSIKTLFI